MEIITIIIIVSNEYIILYFPTKLSRVPVLYVHST